MIQSVNFTSAEEVANAIESGNFPTRQIDNEAFLKARIKLNSNSICTYVKTRGENLEPN